jgi:hypothetical protein
MSKGLLPGTRTTRSCRRGVDDDCLPLASRAGHSVPLDAPAGSAWLAGWACLQSRGRRERAEGHDTALVTVSGGFGSSVGERWLLRCLHQL